MPREQTGQAYRLEGRGRWGLRYYTASGVRRRVSPFPSRSAALRHYRDVIEPELRGVSPVERITFEELCERFLERHAAARSPRTVRTLKERLVRPRVQFGALHLDELDAGSIADFASSLPERWRPSVIGAMRQTLAAGIRYGYITTNAAVLAGVNPSPSPRAVRVYDADELATLETELGPRFGPLVVFAAETGLRPSEWATLERRQVDRARRMLTVQGTKTRGSRREVPLTVRALAALDRSPTRIDSSLVFPADRGGVLNLDNWRRRVWAPAVETAGIARPARIYDLRSTFASRALAAGIAPFELSRVMGTSVRMIELHYGTLMAGAGASIAARLDALA